MGNLIEIPNVNFETLAQIEQNAQGAKENKNKYTKTFDPKNYLDTRLKKGEKKKEMKIRLLPNPDQPGYSPFIKVHTHTLSKLPKEISESGYKSYICLEKSDIDHDKFGKKCPFCEIRSAAYENSLSVMLEAETKVKELEIECNKFKAEGNKIEAMKIEARMSEIKKDAEMKKRTLQELSLNNIPRETVIMRVIERGKEDEGPKFWKVNVSRRGDDAYSLIKNLAERLYKEALEDGDEENLYDSFKGRDIVLTITGSDNEKDNKTTTTVTQARSQSPISRDENLMREWINDSKKWSDVFVVKPYEYLSIISTGEIPWYDRESGKWVPKTVADKSREEYSEKVDSEVNAQMAQAQSVVNEMFINDNDEEQDLPF